METILRRYHPTKNNSTCHPDRSGPILSSAPSSGASGRAVEESWHHPSSIARTSPHCPLTDDLTCHPERSAALYAARSGGIVAPLPL